MNDNNNKKETNIFDNGVSEKEYHKKIKEQKKQSFNDTKEYLDNLKSIENKRFPYKNYGKSYEICAKILFIFCLINLIVSIVLLCIFQDYTFLIDALITCLTWAFTIYCLNGIAISHERIDKLEEQIEKLEEQSYNKSSNKKE